MTKQRIFVGSGINTGDGDTLREAMIKSNNNFDELYDLIGQDSSGKSIDISGNIISSTFTNTDIIIEPNGTGDIVMSGDLVANIIKSDDSTGIVIDDNLILTGIIKADSSSVVRIGEDVDVDGTVTAQAFAGDGSGLTGITAEGTGVAVQDNGASSGTAATINFADGLSVDFSGGTATVTFGGAGDSTETYTNVLRSNDSTEVQVADNLVPQTDNAFSLGTADKRWSGLYVAGSSIHIGNIILQDSGSGTLQIVNADDSSLASLQSQSNTLNVVGDDSTDMEIAIGIDRFYVQGGTNITTSTNSSLELNISVDDAPTFSGVVTAGGLTIGSAVINESDLEQIDDLTAGTVAASKAVVVDANRDIATLRNITSDGTVQFGSLSDGTITATAFADEDDMSSNSATLIPTQQSVKAYVDTQISANNTLVLGDDASSEISMVLSDTLNVKGGNSITSSVTGDGLTFALDDKITVDEISAKDSSAVSIQSALQLDSTLSVVGGANFEGTLTVNTINSADSTAVTINDALQVNGNFGFNEGVVVSTIVDEDDMSSNSDTALATQQSIKAYVDSEISSGTTLTIGADDSTNMQLAISVDSFFIQGGTNVTTSTDSGSQLTISVDDAPTFSGVVTAAGFTIGSAVINEAELEAIDVTAGTVSASKALVVDANRDIATLRNLTSDGTIQFGSLSDGTITATAFVDEDNMISNSATLIPTQQSVKAYVDSVVGIQTTGIQVADSSSTVIDVFDGDLLNVLGTGGITASVVDGGNTLTIAMDASPSFTNVQIDGDLTVSGTTTSVNTTNLEISDALLELNKNNSGGADKDAGLVIQRGSAGNNAALYWNEGDDKFKAVLTTSEATATSVTDSSKATIIANFEGDTATITTISTNQISSGDSSAVQVNDGLNVSGTLSANIIDANTISSSDSTALTINDGVIVVGNFSFDGGASVSTILDEDAMSSNSDTALATQQSIKAYVDSVAGGTIQLGDDASNAGAVDINANEELMFHNGDSITPVVSANGITFNLNEAITVDQIDAGDSSVITINSATKLNSTFSFNGDGTVAVSSVKDEDDLTSNSATALATQQSIKAYVDSQAGGTLSLGDDASNSGNVDVNGGQDLEFQAGNSITPTVAGNGVTFALNDDISVNQIGAKDSTSISITSPLQVASNVQVTGVVTQRTAPTERTHLVTKGFFDDNAGLGGFTNSTISDFPITQDSSATDFHEGSDAVGSVAAIDAFGVAISTLFDCMEPVGRLQATDLGESETHVGA
tara:strand:+ start:1075 stop:4860 length:3786 start_codon:yes stop_codon:yes gene_type:complete